MAAERGTRAELAEQEVGVASAAAEDNALPGPFFHQDTQQKIELFLGIDGVVRLVNLVDGGLVGAEVDVDGVHHVPRCQPQHRSCQRGRQQQRLPLRRAASENFLDVGPEADVEHAVGFVEHGEGDRVQRNEPRDKWSSTRPGVPTTRFTPRAGCATGW